MKYLSGWRIWRCRIGRIRIKPGQTLVCEEDCGGMWW